MFDCFLKIRWMKVFTAGFLFLIVATVVRQVEAILTLNYYMMPYYFGVWSKLMMPGAGPPPPSFLLTSLLFSLLTGIVLAAFYDFTREILPKNKWAKIICFSKMMVVLSFVFFTLPVYLVFNLPFMLLVSWFISSVVIFFLSTIVFVKILK